jgi:Flp pilus assembly protein TadG
VAYQKGNLRTKGQATVEFALTIVFVMVLILGSLELIVLVYTYTVLADAAKEGVRYAIVHGSRNAIPSGPTCPCLDIDGPAAPVGTAPTSCNATGAGCGSGYGVVKTYALYSLHDTSPMSVTVTYPDTGNPPANQAPNRVRVVVTYVYQPFFGLGWPSVTVNAASEGRIFY